MTEVWAPVRGWEGSYEVSTYGRVRSVARTRPNGDGRTYAVPGRLLTPRSQTHGYLVVTLRLSKNKIKIARVHRLVAEAFVPNIDNRPNINHIDCVRDNNIPSNLEWCTQFENLKHMTSLGRRAKHWVGKRSPNAFLSDDTVRKIRDIYRNGGISHNELALKFNVSKKVITNLLGRRTYADVL